MSLTVKGIDLCLISVPDRKTLAKHEKTPKGHSKIDGVNSFFVYTTASFHCCKLFNIL